MDKLCAIRDIRQAVTRFEADFERRYGISLNEGMVLCSLKDGVTLSSGELGEMLGLTPSNASKVIAAAERKGLIERGMGTADKRRMFSPSRSMDAVPSAASRATRSPCQRPCAGRSDYDHTLPRSGGPAHCRARRFHYIGTDGTATLCPQGYARRGLQPHPLYIRAEPAA